VQFQSWSRKRIGGGGRTESAELATSFFWEALCQYVEKREAKEKSYLARFRLKYSKEPGEREGRGGEELNDHATKDFKASAKKAGIASERGEPPSQNRLKKKPGL